MRWSRKALACAAAMFAGVLLTSCGLQETVKPTPVQTQAPAKVALVLGAGASRGFAHIGVLKVLESHNIPVHMIVGTSAGSFVGSLYAYGFNAYQLQKMSLSIERGEIIDLTVPDNGFVQGDLLEEYVNRLLRNTTMEKLRIPFYAVATDIQSGREVVFATGNTGKAVRASCSIPGVFKPARIGGRVYVDGGVVSPIAVDAARRKGADVVIAVDISSDLDTGAPADTIGTILQSVNIMYAKISEGELVKADVVIRPAVGHIGSSAFDMRHEAIMEGERAAMRSLPKIQEIMRKLQQEGRLEP